MYRDIYEYIYTYILCTNVPIPQDIYVHNFMQVGGSSFAQIHTQWTFDSCGPEYDPVFD